MLSRNGTEIMLAESFKELVLRQPIEKITIKEITEKAGVIRPTFYNHFQDKYELLACIIFTDLVTGLERVADHATNIAFSILEKSPMD